jgi:hypothetical protein
METREHWDEKDKWTDYGYTTLMHATEMDQLLEAKQLLDQCADPFLLNKHRNSAFFVAMSNDNAVSVQEFLKTKQTSRCTRVGVPLKRHRC